MQRVLVVEAEHLCRPLGECLADAPHVEIIAVPSARIGVIQALLSRPRLVVTSHLTLNGSLDELESEFEEAGLDNLSVLCECETAVSGQADPRLRTLGELMTAVARIVGTGDRRKRRRIRILARLVRLEDPGELERVGLANLLELGQGELRLESTGELMAGEPIALSFYLPSPESRSDTHPKIAIHGTVDSVLDADRFHYSVKFQDPGTSTRDLLDRYLADFESQRKS